MTEPARNHQLDQKANPVGVWPSSLKETLTTKPACPHLRPKPYACCPTSFGKRLGRKLPSGPAPFGRPLNEPLKLNDSGPDADELALLDAELEAPLDAPLEAPLKAPDWAPAPPAPPWLNEDDWLDEDEPVNPPGPVKVLDMVLLDAPDTEPSLFVCRLWLDALFLLPCTPFSKNVSELVCALLDDCPNWFWLTEDEPAFDCSLYLSFSRIDIVFAFELESCRLPFLSKGTVYGHITRGTTCRVLVERTVLVLDGLRLRVRPTALLEPVRNVLRLTVGTGAGTEGRSDRWSRSERCLRRLVRIVVRESILIVVREEDGVRIAANAIVRWRYTERFVRPHRAILSERLQIQLRGLRVLLVSSWWRRCWCCWLWWIVRCLRLLRDLLGWLLRLLRTLRPTEEVRERSTLLLTGVQRTLRDRTGGVDGRIDEASDLIEQIREELTFGFLLVRAGEVVRGERYPTTSYYRLTVVLVVAVVEEVLLVEVWFLSVALEVLEELEELEVEEVTEVVAVVC
uniref:Uncharacterized protein n=1 Tax=Anopheles farauti TaxID=69004 RepID=A0A182Q5K3_9DIPT